MEGMAEEEGVRPRSLRPSHPRFFKMTGKESAPALTGAKNGPAGGGWEAAPGWRLESP